MVPLLILLLLAVLPLAFLLGQPMRKAWRRRQLKRRVFPAEWRRILRERVPYFRTMPADLQLRLKRHIQVFLAEKPINGCAGLVVDDEIRVTIAAQACLLLLGRRSDYFSELRQILVYPSAFVVDRVKAEPSGVLQDQRQVLAGESWSQGQVILSWPDTLEGAAVPDDGRNVVIHEFAHQLDQEKGQANGAPWQPGRTSRDRWAKVMEREYATLRRRAAMGEASLLSDYGASDPAEFFAVVSEAFFEQPRQLAAEHAELYAQLSGYYRVNPLSWT
ncbi:MAG: zinc-dependent peptidase [Burkholderiales bacterium]|nr:zinc-dependent peptidase [Burkholderiales bacterium]